MWRRVFKVFVANFTTLTNLYNENEIKNFLNFVRRIDNINEETILQYRKVWKLPRKIKYRKTITRMDDFPYIMNINLPYDDKYGFMFKVFNESAIESSINIIEKKSIVSCVIELTDLKFTDEEFYANWNVMQIRKFKPYSPIQEFFMSGCFICDEDDPEDKVYLKIIEKYRKDLETPINLPKIPQMNPVAAAPPPPPPIHAPPIQTKKPEKQPEKVSFSYRPPTEDELMDARSKLRKTTEEKGKKSKKGK